MINRDFSKVSNFINHSVQSRVIPGAVLGVTTSERVIYCHSSGVSNIENNTPMHRHTVFDLASLTKVITTLPSILKLLEEGRLDLSDPIYLYLPEFNKNHAAITIKHLLMHTSGFQPEIKFYLKKSTLKEAILEISELNNAYVPDERIIYSDLNFIILGYIIETIVEQPLNDYTNKIIFEPLNMGDTSYLPSNKKLDDIAATEFNITDNKYQWGNVHDENTRCFGGVSGHAGLFSTMDDVAKYCQMLLNNGQHRSTKFLSKKTIDLSSLETKSIFNLNRTLGWELYNNNSWSGQFLKNGYGHTGFTGTSIWIEPTEKYAIILFTNRLQYGRANNINRFRRIVHNLISLSMSV